MSLSRYASQDIITNDHELYDELFRERGVTKIRQFETPIIYHPNLQDLTNISYETRRWKLGDRLYKIAHEFYGDSTYWWVIAQFNNKPTESHFKVGDICYVPISIESILEYYRI
jgi:hypothetical protein